VEDRVVALQAAMAADSEPAILIAHSAGCVATVVWAGRYTGPVIGALLVTPPMPRRAQPGADGVAGFAVPREKLPFPSILVASRTDPYATFEEFEEMAEDWGSALFDAGDAGHVDTATGYGPWPDGERLLAELDQADRTTGESW
jgi:uncharacterized protein